MAKREAKKTTGRQKLIKVDIRKCGIDKANTRRLRIFQWVVKARAKSTTRYAIDFVRIEPGYIAATDGRHLNYAEGDFSAYQTGCYEVLLNRRNRIVMLLDEYAGKFPNWREILPKHKKFLKSSKPSNGVCDPFAYIFYALSIQGIMVNPVYLQESIWDDGMKCYYGESLDPVHLTTVAGTNKDSYKIGSIVMPTKAPTIKMQEEKI